MKSSARVTSASLRFRGSRISLAIEKLRPAETAGHESSPSHEHCPGLVVQVHGGSPRRRESLVPGGAQRLECPAQPCGGSRDEVVGRPQDALQAEAVTEARDDGVAAGKVSLQVLVGEGQQAGLDQRHAGVRGEPRREPPGGLQRWAYDAETRCPRSRDGPVTADADGRRAVPRRPRHDRPDPRGQRPWHRSPRTASSARSWTVAPAPGPGRQGPQPAQGRARAGAILRRRARGSPPLHPSGSRELLTGLRAAGRTARAARPRRPLDKTLEV